MEDTESKRPMDDPDEQAHFKQVVSAFFNYTVNTHFKTVLLQVDSIRDVARMDRDFSKIDKKYMKYLPQDYHRKRVERYKKAIIANQQVLNQIVREHQGLFDTEKLPNGMLALKPMQIRPTDIIKMRSTIKSFLREWSS